MKLQKAECRKKDGYCYIRSSHNLKWHRMVHPWRALREAIAFWFFYEQLHQCVKKFNRGIIYSSSPNESYDLSQIKIWSFICCAHVDKHPCVCVCEAVNWYFPLFSVYNYILIEPSHTNTLVVATLSPLNREFFRNLPVFRGIVTNFFSPTWNFFVQLPCGAQK